MDITTIAQLIGSLGFPIIACCALFYLYDRTLKEFTQANIALKDALDELASAFKEHREKVEEVIR